MADDRFSERDVEQIIARAIQLDVPGRAMSLERLREVAGELNISPEALNQALAERGASTAGPVRSGIPALNAVPAVSALPAVSAVRAAPAVDHALSQSAVPVDEPRPWRQWIMASSIVAGTLTGALAGAGVGSGDGVTELATITASAGAAALVWAHRRSRRPWEMSAQMLALWGSYAYAFVAAQPGGLAGQMDIEDVIGISLSGASISIVVGTTVLLAVRLWSTRAARRARKAALRLAKAEMRAAKAANVAARAAAALRGDVMPVAPPLKKRAGVRTLFARLTGSFHTPDPSR